MSDDKPVVDSESGEEPKIAENKKPSNAIDAVSDEPDDDADSDASTTIVKTSTSVEVDVTPLARRVEHKIAKLERTVTHEGPLPPPQQLQAYDRVLPGLAERIVSMAEREQNNRHAMQRVEVEGGLELARRGQRYGLAVAVLVLVVSLILVLTGHEVVGGVIA